MKKRRVVITGLGVMSPNGIGKDVFWKNVLKGESGIDFIKSFDASHLPCRIAGEINGFNLRHFAPDKKNKISRMARFSQLGLAAGRLAFEDSSLSKKQASRAGIILGVSIGGMEFIKEQYERYIRKKDLTKISSYTQAAVFTSACPSVVSIDLGLKGPSATISSASASGTAAIGYALEQIRNGRMDIMFAGGSEAPVNEWVLGTYCVTHTVSFNNAIPAKASRPFDKTRDGFVLSEGAGILVLEELEHALARNANIYAEVIGCGMNSEAYHEVRPRIDGEDIAGSISLALQDAGLTPEEVDFISAHGTSTRLNDVAEARAFQKVFDGVGKDTPVSALKSIIGHTQAAAGAIETIAAALAVKTQIAYPTLNHNTPDANCKVHIIKDSAKPLAIKNAIVNSLGFGGYNVSLALKALA